MPILHKKQVDTFLQTMGHSTETRCLVTALCAFMLIQPGIAPHVQTMEEPTPSTTNPKMGAALMDEVVRLRKSYDYIENPTVHTIITSFFLFGSCFGLNKHNAGWCHLREATALAQILGMQDENTYLFSDPLESARNRRLFWLLFVTERFAPLLFFLFFFLFCPDTTSEGLFLILDEVFSNQGHLLISHQLRAYALQKHRPLTLHATINLPTVDQETSTSINGFIHLVNIYRPFDDTFIGLWNKSRTDCSTYWLAQLQRQLTEALPAYLDTTESQAADLRTSQQWLRTMVWQLSITNDFLSSNSPDGSMTFHYPIEIAKDLVAVTSQFSKQSMEVHGIGLVSVCANFRTSVNADLQPH